jgi:5'(3')-deoxyribonucleotidase
MQKTRLVIDVDGVIYDFVDAFMKLYAYHQGTIPEGFEWKDWSAMDALPNQDVVDHLWKRELALFSYGKPYEDSIQALERLNDTYDVVLATATPHVHVNARSQWFKQHAPFIHRKDQMIFLADKSMVVGDLLVEDHLPHIKQWQKVNGNYTALCIDRPWNEAVPPWSYTRVPSLRYVAEILGVWDDDVRELETRGRLAY